MATVCTPTTTLTRVRSRPLPRRRHSPANPDTPEGEKLPDTCNSVMWVAGTSQLKDGAEFLGSTSDEFRCSMSISLSPSALLGIYDVQFLTRETVGANEAHPAYQQQEQGIPTELVGTSIAVGVDSVAVADSQQDNVQFYRTATPTSFVRQTLQARSLQT
ncbi:MAG: hypothetical protein ACLSFT_09395 [Ruminococcus callidus]